MTIDRFDGPNAYLSNFHPSPIEWRGSIYPTVEHAFQAEKAVDEKDREAVRLCPTPGKAKRLGGRIAIRPDWDEVRREVMLQLLRIKFSDPQLRARLLATGDAELVEGNHWGDDYWGVCNGVGQNVLGKLLMQVRAEARTAPVS